MVRNELATERVCTQCQRTKPVTNFRRVRTGSERRRNQCNDCNTRYMRRFRANKRLNRLRRGITPISWSSARPRDIELAITMMIKSFGGLARFCCEWKLAIEDATQNGDHKFALQSFSAIARLTAICSSLNQESDLADLSDNELSDYLSDVLVQQMASQPDRAVTMFKEMGWELRPLDDREMALS